MRRQLSISISFAFISLSISCAGKFDGSVDGDAVPPFTSAVFAQTQKGTETVGVIEAFSFAVDCSRVSSWFVNRTNAIGEQSQTAIDDLQQSDDALDMPDGAWRSEIQVAGTLGFDGDFSLGTNATQRAHVTLVHQRSQPDETAAVVDGHDPNVDTFFASSGDFTVDNFTDNSSVRLTGTDLVFTKPGESEGAGDGTMTLNATFCSALNDDVIADFRVLDSGGEGVSDPRGGAGEGEGGVGPAGGACFSSDDCPNIVCICDDGTDIGNPVNTQNCDNGNCDTPDVACPASCDSFGQAWTGTVGDSSPPTDSTPGQTGDCFDNLGAGDGCDCGCGEFDSDCSDLSSSVCDADHCVSGFADANDNSQCSNG